MKHPDLLARERNETFRKIRDRYWYRWVGIFTLALSALVALVYAVQSGSYAVVITLVSSAFVVGIAIAGRLARQRALDDMRKDPDAQHPPPAD